jgi:uncharacterized membrane protein
MAVDPFVVSDVERFAGRLLRAGVALAALLLFVGLVAWSADVDEAIAEGLFWGGFLVLMATPLVRVVVSLVEYVRAREWMFVLATLGVLAVLSGTMWVALSH